MEKGIKKEKESCFYRDLNPGPCAWQGGMLTTTRTDFTNYNEILSITITEQIFEA